MNTVQNSTQMTQITQMFANHLIINLRIFALFASFAFPILAQAYTEADIDLAYDAFNRQFFSQSDEIYYEKSTQSGKVAAIWTQAIFLDIAENAFLRTGSPKDSLFFRKILEGNRKYYDSFNWDNGKVWFIYDDIMWWVITLARTAQITGEKQWLDLSASGFERVWSGSKVLKDRGSYDPVRGGMYWAWDQQHPKGTPRPSMGKMACINYPTVIAAMTLFDATGDSAYFRKGKEIYRWSRDNLFDRRAGIVADSKHGDGSPAWKRHVYNQATCIGAAVMLYRATGNSRYLSDAVLAADYTKNQMSSGGFLHFENGVEQGIYHAIFAQYIVRLIEDGGQSQYLPWLRRNMDAGWANRLPSHGITYKDYARPAPGLEKIESYDASGIPALMQVIKPLDADGGTPATGGTQITQITQMSADRHCEGDSPKQSRTLAVRIASPQATRNDDSCSFASFASFAFPSSSPSPPAWLDDACFLFGCDGRRVGEGPPLMQTPERKLSFLAGFFFHCGGFTNLSGYHFSGSGIVPDRAHLCIDFLRDLDCRQVKADVHPFPKFIPGGWSIYFTPSEKVLEMIKYVEPYRKLTELNNG
jgi:predicted alpha-1,6-mannanase (GH76 family)